MKPPAGTEPPVKEKEKMDRSNFDTFWNDIVEKMNDGTMKCKFCRRLFPKGTSISRIKWHLSGEKGHNVSICTGQVPKEVQEAALQAMRGGNKRRKTVASSSNVNDNAISSCPQEENNEFDDSARDAGGMQMAAVQDTAQGVGEGRTSSPAEVGNLMQSMAGETMQSGRGEASQAPDIVGQAIGRNWDERHDILMNDGTGGVAQPDAGASSSGRRTLPTTKPVGRAFEDNKNAIWSCLMDDGVSSIGIYGIGGVGKTMLVKHIYNQLQKNPDIFHHVYWITVSQDFSINTLQNTIAKRINLDLSNEEEEPFRSAKLSEQLMEREKWIFILDDLWSYFDLQNVGIPDQVKGCKVILTTRSEEVCQQMVCQKKIKVKPLLREEAWDLFMEKLGRDTALLFEVKQIAESVVNECAGLPLGIVTMAAAMRGVVDIREWRHVLGELKESKVRRDDMEPKVFRILRFSYTNLKDSSLQQCLLYCSLFPGDFDIKRDDLIDYLIDEEVIKGMNTRQAGFDTGHSMLKKLLNVCLLESSVGSDSTEFVRMHDLIRDMAIQIQQENSTAIVKAGGELRELPDAEEWTENLVRVSLMENQIEEIPPIHSPRCNNLSTLLLSDNDIQSIADSFFEQLKGLKVLDLSRTSIVKLPNSVSGLVSLISLLLSECRKLRHVPSLKELKRLKRLDLSYTALEEVPQDVGCLSNLRYLRLNEYEYGEKQFPIGILPQLSHLQVFLLEGYFDNTDNTPVTVKGEEVACLRKLEILECHFEGHSDLVEYFKSRDHTQSLSRYHILVGVLDEDYESWEGNVIARGNSGKRVCLGNFSIRGDLDISFFPSDIQELIIFKWNDARSLCDVFSLAKAKELEFFTIMYCSFMESFFPSSWFCAAPPPSPSNGIFRSLTEFECYNCTSMKKLFPPFLLPNLANLREISVRYCKKMEEIIAGRDEEGVTGEEISLPKLESLTLANLPKLKSICSAKLRCDSLEEIEVQNCGKLKRMPICLPLLDNGQPSPPPSLRRIHIEPKKWWESVVEWEHPNAKDVLRPFVWFWDIRRSGYVRPGKHYSKELEVFTIAHCSGMESLFPSSWFCAAPPPSQSNGVFCSLRKFECFECRSMKKLFHPSLLPNLANLREISVADCGKMEEIIAGRDEEGVTGEEISLPKLESLTLANLPKLKSICSAKLRCDSLEIIRVQRCQKLKRMPICLPLLDDGQPSPPPSLRIIWISPKEWWESVVEWEHPNAKDVLRPWFSDIRSGYVCPDSDSDDEDDLSDSDDEDDLPDSDDDCVDISDSDSDDEDDPPDSDDEDDLSD